MSIERATCSHFVQASSSSRLDTIMATSDVMTRDAPHKSTLSTSETWYLHSICALCVTVLIQTLQGDGAPLTISLAFSGLAFATTYALIRWLGPSFMRVGLKGKDMSKVRKIEMCVVCGCSGWVLRGRQACRELDCLGQSS